MESSLGEAERVRGIFEVAISRPLLDMPEVSPAAFRHPLSLGSSSLAT